MAYRVEVGPQARTQLEELDAAVEAAVERKMIWLAQNAASMVHRAARWYARRLSRSMQIADR